MLRDIVYFSNDKLVNSKEMKSFLGENGINVKNIIYKENGIYVELDDEVEQEVNKGVENTSNLATPKQVSFALSLTDKYVREQLEMMTKKEIGKVIKEEMKKKDDYAEKEKSRKLKTTHTCNKVSRSNVKMITPPQKKYIIDNIDKSSYTLEDLDIDNMTRNDAGRLIKELSLQ
ncbi:hypothetical protein [uncultured Megamonas sp.]|uniref:hypothetical protein n=1 Tax=uncultured Megamonas sp. TaxID=286140 RepID=UPI00259B0E75|nr:hypothetical protein [uncultured Megamonas sp.]